MSFINNGFGGTIDTTDLTVEEISILEVQVEKTVEIDAISTAEVSDALVRIANLDVSESRRNVEYLKKVKDIGVLASNAATKAELDGLRIIPPSFTGNTKAMEGTSVQITISNYDGAVTYSNLTVSKGTVDRTDGVITWDMPTALATLVDEDLTLEITASQNGKADNTATYTVRVDNYDGVSNQVALYENTTISGTEYDTLDNVSIAGNTISHNAGQVNYTLGSGSATEAIIVEEVQEGDLLVVDGKKITIGTISDESVPGSVSSINPLSEGTSSLIAKYELNGNLNDTTGSYNGTNDGITFTTGDGGKFGEAAIFNGTNSHMETGVIPLSGNQNLTIALWVYITDHTADEVFAAVSREPSDSEIAAKFAFGIQGGYLDVDIYSEHPIQPGTLLTSNTWTHVVLTHTNGTYQTYINGVLDRTDTGTALNLYGTSVFWLGGYYGVSEFFDGKLEQVSVFNKVLNSGEVTTIYNEGEDVPAYGFDITSLSLGQAPTSIKSLPLGSATSVVLNQDGADNDWVGYQTTSLSDIRMYNILEGATENSVTLTGNPVVEGDVILLGSGESTTLEAFDTTGHYTDNLDGTYTINISSSALTAKPAFVAKDTNDIQISLVDEAAQDDFRSGTKTSYVSDVEGDTNNVSAINSLDIFEDGSCIATYNLDGDALDLSTNNNGVATNISYADGKFGQAAVYNGSDSSSGTMINTNINNISGSHTLSVWAYVESGTGGSLLTTYNGTSNDKMLTFDIGGTTNIRFIGNNSWNVTVDTATYVSLNNWNHFVGVIDDTGTTAYLYINGALVGSSAITITGTYLPDDLIIGRWQSWNGAHYSTFNNKIDQVRVFNRDLTAEEIASLYAETTSGGGLVSSTNPFEDGSLLSKYQFEDDTTDLTGNQNVTGYNLTYPEGKFNNGIAFNGSNGRIDMIDRNLISLSSTSYKTFSMWVKLESDTDRLVIQDRWRSDTGNAAATAINVTFENISINAGNAAGSSDNGTTYAEEFIFPQNEWAHIVVVHKNGGTCYIYANGTKLGTGGYYKYNTGYPTQHTSQSINHGSVGYSLGYQKCQLDQFEIYNKQLSDTEVSALYTQSEFAIMPSEITTTYAKVDSIQGRDLKHKVNLQYSGDTTTRVSIDLDKDEPA